MTIAMKGVIGIGAAAVLGPATLGIAAGADSLGGLGELNGTAWTAPTLSLGMLQDEAPAAPTGRISDGTNFYFRIAGWYTLLDANLSYGDQVALGPVDLDFEETLGYDQDVLTLRGMFGWTIAKRHHLDFGINGPLDYDGRLTKEASFNNFLFAADASSELDLVGLDADYSYDLVHDEEFRFYVTGGIRAFLFRFDIEGEATDKDGNSFTRSESLDAGAGLPVLGGGLRWDFTRKMYIAAKVVGLYAGDYGNSFDANFEFGWDFTKHFGAFAGFRYLHSEIDDIDIDDSQFSFSYDLYGPFVGIEVRF